MFSIVLTGGNYGGGMTVHFKDVQSVFQSTTAFDVSVNWSVKNDYQMCYTFPEGLTYTIIGDSITGSVENHIIGLSSTKTLGYSSSDGYTLASGVRTRSFFHRIDGNISTPLTIYVSAKVRTYNLATGKYGETYNLTGEGTYTPPKIDRHSTLSASTMYVGEEHTIIVNSQIPDILHTIKYRFQPPGRDPVEGIVVELEDGSTNVINWYVPDDYSNMLGDDGSICYLRIDTYKKTEIHDPVADFIGTWEGQGTIRNRDIGGPSIVNIQYCDINSKTIGLTGDDTKIIKYFSNLQVSADVGDSPNLSYSVKIVYGNEYKQLSGKQGTYTANFKNAENYNVRIIANIQGITRTEVHPIEFIEYQKLTCHIDSSYPTVRGDMDVSIQGNYFNQSFGAQDNSLTLRFRYGAVDGSFVSDEMTIPLSSITFDGNSYSTNIKVSGLDYQKEYYIFAVVIDKLMTSTAQKTVNSRTIFDWGKNDFKFSVPVNCDEAVIFVNSKGVSGINKDGEEDLVFVPRNSVNSTVINYSGYQNENSNSYLYGSDIHLLSHNNITANGKSLVGLINSLINNYSFETTVAKGTKPSSASCALTLLGNNLHCRIYVSYSTSPGTGALSAANGYIGKFTFNPEGKITHMEEMDGITGGSGTTAGMAIKNVVFNDDGTISFEAYLANVATSGYSFMSSFIIPVSLDLNAFV